MDNNWPYYAVAILLLIYIPLRIYLWKTSRRNRPQGPAEPRADDKPRE